MKILSSINGIIKAMEQDAAIYWLPSVKGYRRRNEVAPYKIISVNSCVVPRLTRSAAKVMGLEVSEKEDSHEKPLSRCEGEMYAVAMTCFNDGCLCSPVGVLHRFAFTREGFS